MAIANSLTKEPSEQVQFRQLLEEAVTKPGTLMKAYSLFWNYSLGNQILALVQADRRGIPLGPIASFNRWKELGRHVKRGERAIELCMPIVMKRAIKQEGADGNEIESEVAYKRFVFRRNWFMLSQTDGADYTMPARFPRGWAYRSRWWRISWPLVPPLSKRFLADFRVSVGCP